VPEIRFRVNDEEVSVDAHPMTRLLDVLREHLHLTGTKEGCGEGECGACAVLLDGRLVNSCLVPIVQVAGQEVLTIEGLAGERGLDRVQQAFIDEGGAQCGICTPGMILAAAPLKRGASLPEIKTALAGNLCRCTGYPAIFRSVDAALNRLPRRSSRAKVRRKRARSR